MAKLRIRYLTARPNKGGSTRHYWQPDKILACAGWKMRRLSDVLHEAMSQAEEINQAVDQWRANLIDKPVNEKPGTIDALIAAYKNSRKYKEKAIKTKRDYDYYLQRIAEWAGDVPAAAINPKMVQDLYEANREKSARKATYLIQVLRLLFSFAERENIIPIGTNPARRPSLDYKAGKGVLWSPEAIKHFVKTADDMDFGAIGTAVMLNEWLGQRRGDLLKMSMNAYRNGHLYIRQSKTNAEVTLPVDMVPSLKARLELQIAHNKKSDAARRVVGTNLIQGRGGRPYTDDGFTTIFDRIREQAALTMPGLAKLVFKDLRHTAVTRLAEAGAEIPMIAAVTGHTFRSCQDIVDRYNVRTSKMAQEAFQRRINTTTNQQQGEQQ